MASMVMVILLLNNTISKYKRSLLAMKTAMVLDLLGLLGALFCTWFSMILPAAWWIMMNKKASMSVKHP